MYKDAAPLQTIEQIKQILSTLGIETRETLYNKDNLCYSCRIAIDSHGLESLDIGTNGKGMSPEYALASGYAELMERLQNKFLVNEAMRHAVKISSENVFDFRFFPDETVIESSLRGFFRKIQYLFPNYDCSDEERFCELVIGPCNRAWESMGSDHEKSPQIEYLCVPFARFSRNDKYNGLEEVPIILARANSSTGLCAGNTPHEAILQGINEIFERYVLQRVYLDYITPPSYPNGYFQGSKIGEKLECLAKEGYVYDIKDMSLGRGFPVVGLILTNTNNGTTMFRLGADLSPEIALERCLTEIYQGRTEDDNRFLEYPIHKAINIEGDIQLRNNEYKRSLKDGTGHLPKSIFGGTPTYSFHGPVLHSSGDSKQDFKQVLRFLHEHDYTLFVRDNSFLGFCAYQIIIPGLSDQDHHLRNIFGEYFSSFDLDIGDKTGVSHERDAVQWSLYDIKSQGDIRAFVEKNYPNDDSIRMAPYNTATQNVVNKHLLLFLSAIKNCDYKYANKHLEAFMQQRYAQGYPYDAYLACVGSYVYCKSIELADNEIRSWLNHFYKKDIADEVVADFRNPEEIMKNYSFPTCFNCAACPLISTCHFQDAIDFERMIQQVQKNSMIDQNKLFDILN